MMGVQVKECAGMVKDHAWIHDVHKEIAEELRPVAASRLLDLVLDNAKANRSAMRMLEEIYPRWIMVGCNAHALNLLLKVLATDSWCPGTAKV
jgi:hypothetical protein